MIVAMVCGYIQLKYFNNDKKLFHFFLIQKTNKLMSLK